MSKKICPRSEDGNHLFTEGSTNCYFCGRGAFIYQGQVLYVPNSDLAVNYHSRVEPNVLFYGGRGSGKSVTGRWDAHMRAMTYPGFKYCILRRTYPELLKSHLVDLPREMKQLGGDFNHTDKIAKYPNGSLGFFSHCNTEQDVLNLLSAEFYLMFFDEISTFDWEMFIKLAASCRIPRAFQELMGIDAEGLVRAATNPLGISAEQINRYWVLKDITHEEDPLYNPNDWYAIKANAEDNPYLSDTYQKRFSGMDEHTRKAWVEGEFTMENALFDLKPKIRRPNGDVTPYHVINDLDLKKILQSATVYRAIDAGWFPDPTVCLWIAHLGNRHIVFHERTWFKTTAVDIAHDILEDDKKLGIKRVAITYCDPSMDINTTADVRTIKEIYEANGIAMENSINDREDFAMAMHQALAEEAHEYVPRIQFYVNGIEGCPMLVRTIPQMKYDDKNYKKMADHKKDHWVVTCCYYLLSHSADIRSEVQLNQSVMRPWMKPKGKDHYVLGSDQVRDRT